MRKFCFVLFTFLFTVLSAVSQDLIVTDSGDSINCRITKIKKDYIYFTFKHDDEIRSTLLPESEVTSYLYDHFKESEVPVNKVIGYKGYQQLRIALSGGYSYQTAKVDESLAPVFQDYTKELKSGYHFCGDMGYFFTEHIGVGFKYNFFKTSNVLYNIYVEDINGNMRLGELSDNITVSFLGPTVLTRLLAGDKTKGLILNFSIGYLSYSDDMKIVDSYKVTGNTMGTVWDVGYDIILREHLSLGLQVSYTSGYLFKQKLDDGTTTETIEFEPGEYVGLSRFDFSVGLRLDI